MVYKTLSRKYQNYSYYESIHDLKIYSFRTRPKKEKLLCKITYNKKNA